MKNKKKVRIDLGRGLIFEDGELKEGQPSQEWMTWDEGWQWVIASLKKIKDAYEYSPQNIITIEDEVGFRLWAQPVWEMLTRSYENVGGLDCYRSFADFCHKEHLFILVLDENRRLMACATYRRMIDHRKMVAIGCEQSKEGRVALRQIVQDNIKNFELQYWMEVSGRIEHYFKKHNGYSMPNVLASEILNVDELDVKLSEKDHVHYCRQIAGGDFYEKMIMCAKNEELFKKVLEEVENYGTFMKKDSSARNDAVKQAIYVIENIYRAHEEDGFNELIPSWHHGLLDSLETLQSVTPKTQVVIDYIRYAEYLLDDMQLLEWHPLILR